MSEVKDWNAIDALNTDLDGYALSNPYQHVTRSLMGAVKRKFDDVDVEIAGLAGAYTYKGTVDTVADLPATGNQVGDVYNVTTGDAQGNYAWDGAQWDKTGDSLVDVDGAQVTATGSTTPRTLGRRFSDVINVKDFGAAGDGAASSAALARETAAVQAALDAAAAANAAVFFPHGRYAVSSISSSVSMYGEGAGVTTIRGYGSSGATIVWNCSESKAIRNIGVVADSGQDGILYTGGVRVKIENVDVNLRGDGTAIKIDPSRYFSRMICATNVEIYAQSGNNTVGFDIKKSPDSWIGNAGIFGCKRGILLNEGTTSFFLSNVHVWCGDTEPYHDAWWDGTVCILTESPVKIFITNLYLDTACAGMYFKKNASVNIEGLFYADDGAYLASAPASSLFAKGSGAEKAVVNVDGGIVFAARQMLYPYGSSNVERVIDNVSTIVAPSPSFQISNRTLQRSYETQNMRGAVSVSGSGYTPIAYIYSRYNGEYSCSIQTSGSKVCGDLTVDGLDGLSFSGDDMSSLFYTYDSGTFVYTVYLHHTDSETAFITTQKSDSNHFRFLHENLFIGTVDTPFAPETLESDTGLTQI